MKAVHSCSTCAFVREGDIKDLYRQGKGWLTHRGLLCHLFPPYRGYTSPVDADGICSRWTDAETNEQPLAHLCPQTVFISTATANGKPNADAETEVQK